MQHHGSPLCCVCIVHLRPITCLGSQYFLHLKGKASSILGLCGPEGKQASALKGPRRVERDFTDPKLGAMTFGPLVAHPDLRTSSGNGGSLSLFRVGLF